jgi:prefoldin subunit 5
MPRKNITIDQHEQTIHENSSTVSQLNQQITDLNQQVAQLKRSQNNKAPTPFALPNIKGFALPRC